MPVFEVEGIGVELSNLDKILWPDLNLTKADIISYYIKVSPYLLPHLQDRPVVLTRYPDGIKGKAFYQKNIPESAPEWVTTFPIYSSHSRRRIDYCVVDKLPTLVWLANLAAVEIHPFLSRIISLNYPDFAVFDLDPMEQSTWEDVCHAALVLKEALDYFQIKGYPKTSGSTGIQVYVPLKNKYSYKEARLFTLLIARAVHTVIPEITTLERRVEERQGKLYLDCFQNSPGKTLASVYSLRPRPGAPVSAPVTWEEIEQRKFVPGDFNIFSIFSRLREKGDLFASVLKEKQSIDHVLEKLQ